MMLNSRLFSTLLLIFAVLSVGLGYIYYGNKKSTNILHTNFGDVNLGAVYQEQIIVKVEIAGLLDDSLKFEEVTIAPIVDPMKNVDDTMNEIFIRLNSYKNDNSEIKFNEAKPKVDMKLKLSTQIIYRSDNFKDSPFIFSVAEKTYDLKKDESLRLNIEKALKDNFESVRKDLSVNLFLTNPLDLNLIEKWMQ